MQEHFAQIGNKLGVSGYETQEERIAAVASRSTIFSVFMPR